MGCGPSRGARDGVAGGKKADKISKGGSMKAAAADKPEETEADYLVQFVAGYTCDYPQKGTVTTYEDYRGFDTSTTNHVSKGKVDKLCKWSDLALQDRQLLNNDVFFNPQNPSAWPRDVITAHLTSPSFADRHTVQEASYK
ncbi:hypothetical protein NESM_000150300 [Novymonas esmeraldas]|uniref:Uncharacterized protein n=1 Tax=Novymonas esmeraldas TaxID=1808958 RepID=A0AAW0F5H8_9TRYP